MASDSREFEPIRPAPQVHAAAVRSVPQSTNPEAADLQNAIGYEAADPALQAALWAEAIDAGAARGSLR